VTATTAPPDAPLPRLSRSAAWLLLAQAVAIASGLLVTVAISRILGPEELGRWRFVFALFAYAVVFSDLGLTTLAIREIARRPAAASDYALPVVSLQLAMAGLTYAVIVVGTQLLPIEQETKWLAAVFGLVVFPQALSMAHVLQATERMELVARIRILMQAASSVIGLVGLFLTEHLLALVVPMILTQVVTSAWIALRVRRDHGVRFNRPKTDWLLRLLGDGRPFLLASVALLLIFNADAIILGLLRGERQLGFYAAAYALASQLLMVGGPIMAAVYPRLAALSGDRDRGLAVVRPLLGVLGLAILPVALGGLVVADKVVAFLYGAGYESSVPVLMILLGLPAIGYYNTALMQSLSAAGHQPVVMRISFLTAAANIALNVILIVSLGIVGAAIAMILAELVAATAYSVALARRLDAVVIGDYLSTLPAAAFMALVVLLARVAFDAPLLVAIAIGAVTYAASLGIYSTPASRLVLGLLRQGWRR
jgi:O-antigen/teichoic acid export membrane protein